MIEGIIKAHLKEVTRMLDDLQSKGIYQVNKSYVEWHEVAYEQILNTEALLGVVGEDKYLELYRNYWEKLDPNKSNSGDISRLLNYAQLALECTLDEVQRIRYDGKGIEKGPKTTEDNAFDSALSLWLNDLDEMLNESDLDSYHKAVGYIDWYDRVNEQLSDFGVLEDDAESQYSRFWRNAAPSSFPRDYTSNSSIHSLIRFAKSALLAIREGNKEDFPVVGELFPLHIVDKSKGFVRNVARQANGCYEKGWYDASAVMLRRLLEILIIDCFDVYDVLDQVRDDDGNIFSLGKLVETFLAEPNDLWHIERGVSSVIRKLKNVGDSAAHGRYKKTLQQSLDRHKENLEIAIQQLVAIIERGMSSA